MSDPVAAVSGIIDKKARNLEKRKVREREGGRDKSMYDVEREGGRGGRR